MQDPRFFPLALHRLPEVGAATYVRLVEQFGSARQVFSQSSGQLEPFLKPAALAALSDFQHNPEASAIGQKVLQDVDWLKSRPDVSVLELADNDYPALLRHIPKPPPLLFVRGNRDCLNLPQIALVGSRNPSTGGAENAQRFARYLAENGFAITSGLALGVDAAAHEGALLANGHTIAVMGTGIDLVYPARHRPLAQRILDSGGALISEFPLGTASLAAHFPQRNRIISGLSYGVLVVEAALQSGSLITAQTALQQNREVFAIPGSIHNPLARGCHQLIRQGATLVETASDIVDQLDGMLGYQRESLLKVQRAANPDTQTARQSQRESNAGNEGKHQRNEPDISALPLAEQQLINAMGYDPINIDELVERTGIAVGSIAAQLVVLEIKGFVQQCGGGYQRI